MLEEKEKERGQGEPGAIQTNSRLLDVSAFKQQRLLAAHNELQQAILTHEKLIEDVERIWMRKVLCCAQTPRLKVIPNWIKTQFGFFFQSKEVDEEEIHAARASFEKDMDAPRESKQRDSFPNWNFPECVHFKWRKTASLCLYDIF